MLRTVQQLHLQGTTRTRPGQAVRSAERHMPPQLAAERHTPLQLAAEMHTPAAEVPMKHLVHRR